jgi:hypothetical protein
MKFDRVDPLSLDVEIVQYRAMPIGQAGMLVVFGAAEAGAGLHQVHFSPTGPFAVNRLLKRRIAGKEVVVPQRWRLVENGVSR